MANAILLLLRPLLVNMAFSLVRAALKLALNGVDAWMRKKVESTDTKYDDAAYAIFVDNKTGIMDALDRVVGLISGSK